jgi:predicted neuraminidase
VPVRENLFVDAPTEADTLVGRMIATVHRLPPVPVVSHADCRPVRATGWAIGLLASAVLLSGGAYAQGKFEAEFIFDAARESHGHVHASCLIEGPNGDLRAVWYENGTPLPSPYFSKQQDKSDNVRIGGARKAKDAKEWDRPFVMADTFGVSDNNPCLAVDKQNRLWLIYATLLGVPEWSWGSALIRYSVSSNFDHAGAPIWDKQNILVPHGLGLGKNSLAELGKSNPLIERLGWMPRAHPLVRSDGALVLPLANENFGIACMAITRDGGETWTFSNPVPGRGLEQPTLAELADGTIIAFFRNDGLEHRIKRSESKDGGMTWGPLTVTDRPHPGAGIEATMLRNGHLALIYNDTEKERDRLAISISTDNGTTWQWTRHIENTPKERFDYPSIIQSKDGSIHVTYSYNTKTIKHAHFNEAWVQEGDAR